MFTGQEYLWNPTDLWRGEDAILIGGGSSLQNFPFEKLAGKKVIGINHAYKLGSHIVSLCYFGDAQFWEKEKWNIEESDVEFVTDSPALLPLNLPYIHKMKRLQEGIGEGSTLGWNWSSGAAAINLAYTMGARRIFLLGYDLTNLEGRSHWHYWNPAPIPEESFNRFRRGFEIVAKELKGKVDIFNVTDGSSQLYLFPRVNFEKFFEMTSHERNQKDQETESDLVEESGG
jgi:hypothetical protein